MRRRREGIGFKMSINFTDQTSGKNLVRDTVAVMFSILKPERSFYAAAIIYGVAISLFTLAAPISVQTLINTVANTALSGQVLVLASVLFALLMFSGLLYAFQKYLMELFERRFFARVVSEIVMQNIYANVVYFRSINRAELVNRYFDIMTIQKNMPYILTGGFALILQSIVGLVVTSFYHPALFTFNMIFIGSVYLIWRIWGHRSIRTAIALSNSKYDVAQWLEEIAHVNTDFKSHDRIIYALNRSDSLTADYMHKRKKHFAFTFRQLLGFLTIYAVFSASLLGLGGLLVINGELTLGQLVAAELILTAIFYGVSQADTYLDMIYELAPAAEKISYFHQIPTEEDEGKIYIPEDCFNVNFKNVRCDYRDGSINYDFEIKAGQKVLACVSSHTLQEYFIDLIKAYREPDRGQILLGGQDISDLNPQSFRDKIYLMDEVLVLETSIEDYLRISKPDATKVQIMEILSLLHMEEAIDALPDGLETKLINTGYPLSISETVRLKLAAGLLSNPHVIILTEHFDVIGYHIRQSVLKYLATLEGTTVIYFTNRRDIECFDTYLYLDWEEDSFHQSLDELRAIARSN